MSLLIGARKALLNSVAVGAFGTPYSVGTVFSTANANTATITTTAAAPAGATVVVAVYFGSNNNINSVADSAGGNTWTGTTQVTLGGTTSKLRMFSSKLVNAIPAGGTITITFAVTTTAEKRAVAAAVTGAGSLDKSLTGSGSTSSAPSIALGTLAAENEIVFLGLMALSTITTPVTEPTGYALVANYGSASSLQLSYRVVASSLADTPTYGLSASVGWAIQAQSFTRS